jgi:hypothetical protein
VPASMEAENENDNWNEPESPSSYDGSDVEQLGNKASQHGDKVQSLKRKQVDLLEALRIGESCEEGKNMLPEELRHLQSVLSKIDDDPSKPATDNIIAEALANTQKMLDTESKQENYLNKASELDLIKQIEERGVRLTQEQKNIIKDYVNQESLENHRANIRALGQVLSEDGDDDTNSVGILNSMLNTLNRADASEVSDENDNSNND